jgi:hypothetical protein
MQPSAPVTNERRVRPSGEIISGFPPHANRSKHTQDKNKFRNENFKVWFMLNLFK